MVGRVGCVVVRGVTRLKNRLRGGIRSRGLRSRPRLSAPDRLVGQQPPVHDGGELALELAQRLEFAVALGDLAREVGPAGGAVADLTAGGDVQDLVQLPVATPR